jgi:hypothetical protein
MGTNVLAEEKNAVVRSDGSLSRIFWRKIAVTMIIGMISSNCLSAGVLVCVNAGGVANGECESFGV